LRRNNCSGDYAHYALTEWLLAVRQSAGKAYARLAEPFVFRHISRRKYCFHNHLRQETRAGEYAHYARSKRPNRWERI